MRLKTTGRRGRYRPVSFYGHDPDPDGAQAQSKLRFSEKIMRNQGLERDRDSS